MRNPHNFTRLLFLVIHSGRDFAIDDGSSGHETLGRDFLVYFITITRLLLPIVF